MLNHFKNGHFSYNLHEIHILEVYSLIYTPADRILFSFIASNETISLLFRGH